jgi:hypothetical protein
MTSNSNTPTIDSILTDTLNNYYDYIYDKDIVKIAQEYSEKTIFKDAKSALVSLIQQTCEEVIGEFELSAEERAARYIGRPDHQRDALRESQRQRLATKIEEMK